MEFINSISWNAKTILRSARQVSGSVAKSFQKDVNGRCWGRYFFEVYDDC